MGVIEVVVSAEVVRDRPSEDGDGPSAVEARWVDWDEGVLFDCVDGCLKA